MKIPKITLNKILFLLLVVSLCFFSYGKALESFFWKDDWAWLWTANFNPSDFFHSTIGDIWFIRTGLFMYPYILYLYKIITNSYYWQIIGLGLKIVNSLIFYYFIYSITKKKYLAILAAFIFASYSGGIESYTWYKLSALATGFVLLGFTFYSKFLENISNKYLLFAVISFVLAFMSNMGRPAGLIPVIVLWAGLEVINKKRKNRDRGIIIVASSSILILYLLLIKIVNNFDKPQPGLMVDSLKNIKIYFGIIGNLLKNPFVRYFEIGYLYHVDKLGIFLGVGLFVVGVVLGIIYLTRKSNFIKYLIIFIGWIYLFYYPNWIYGGGSILTILGSGHRYLTLSGIGLIAFWVILLSGIKKSLAILISIFIIFLNIRYSRHLISLEYSVRNIHLVEPIYKQLDNEMRSDDHVELIILDTPNLLKSFVAQGWYPYTYAYYKGLRDISDFPIVIPFWDDGIDWVCATDTNKSKIQLRGGFANTRKTNNIDVNHIYAWSLTQNGTLTNRTNQLRNIASECMNKGS